MIKLVKVDKDGDDTKSGEKLDEPSEFDRGVDSIRAYLKTLKDQKAMIVKMILRKNRKSNHFQKRHKKTIKVTLKVHKKLKIMKKIQIEKRL